MEASKELVAKIRSDPSGHTKTCDALELLKIDVQTRSSKLNMKFAALFNL